MGRRLPSPSPSSLSPSTLSTSPSSSSSHSGQTTGVMFSNIEQRRKHSSIDSQSLLSPTERLMSDRNFSLDHIIPDGVIADKGGGQQRANGFFALSKKEQRNFLLLITLYFLQGLPIGLATGSVPLLLKKHVSYAQMGIFTLAAYPYSLKLFWSPVVDALWSHRFGRRKSWILPVQALSGVSMIWLARHIETLMNGASEDSSGVWKFTFWWFGLVFMSATQDIAVDGWGISLMSPQNISYATTAQTIGLAAGYFLTSTIFMALNAPEFANRWFRSTPGPDGLISLGGMLSICGWLFLIITIGLALFKREDVAKNQDGIWKTYKVMWNIFRFPSVQGLMMIHLIAKLGFQANEEASRLKLIDKGFGQDNMAFSVLIDFPFEIATSYYVGELCAEYQPIPIYCWGFLGKLVAAVAMQIIIALRVDPAVPVSTGYLFLVILGRVFSACTSAVTFVALSAFHATVADPLYGGTYMTLLATSSNLGGTFPKFFVLKSIDMLTVATCESPSLKPFKPFSCVAEADKNHCKDLGGECNISRDGYNWTNVLCVIIGLVTFFLYIRPKITNLQRLPLSAWRLGGGARGITYR